MKYLSQIYVSEGVGKSRVKKKLALTWDAGCVGLHNLHYQSSLNAHKKSPALTVFEELPRIFCLHQNGFILDSSFISMSKQKPNSISQIFVLASPSPLLLPDFRHLPSLV